MTIRERCIVEHELNELFIAVGEKCLKSMDNDNVDEIHAYIECQKLIDAAIKKINSEIKSVEEEETKEEPRPKGNIDNPHDLYYAYWH